MIETIFAFMGYCKIPKEAVKISTTQEYFIEKLIKHESDERGKALYRKMLDGQQCLTKFLRTGRLLQ